MSAPRQPTSEECTTNATVLDAAGRVGRACWWPSTGGYVARAVAVVDLAKSHGVDVYVWHDGRFPFDGHCQRCSDERSPVVLHHCQPGQFIALGQFLSNLTDAP